MPRLSTAAMVAAPILARRTPSASPFYGGGHSGSVNNLINTAGVGGKGNLLTNNPNRDAAGKQVNPRRLDPANINDILTCDQDMGMRTNSRPSMVRPTGIRPRWTSSSRASAPTVGTAPRASHARPAMS